MPREAALQFKKSLLGKNLAGIRAVNADESGLVTIVYHPLLKTTIHLNQGAINAIANKVARDTDLSVMVNRTQTVLGQTVQGVQFSLKGVGRQKK